VETEAAYFQVLLLPLSPEWYHFRRFLKRFRFRFHITAFEENTFVVS
jgi:hypothetical protein